MAEKTERKRGRPPKNAFQPGNPGGPGSPKTPPEIKAMIQAHGPVAIKLLIDTLNDTTARKDLRMKAAEILLDRGYGKPAQEVNVNAVGKMAIIFDPVLREELDKANE